MTIVALRATMPNREWAADIIRQWRWRTSMLAGLVGLATLVFSGYPLLYGTDLAAKEVFRVLAFNVLQFGFPLIFAVGMADRSIDAGAWPLVAYSIAVISTGLAGVWPIAALLSPVLRSDVPWSISDDVQLVTASMVSHGILVGAYAKWRGERRARERLQAVERERASEQRRVNTSRLLALQAKVEPQLLFDALGRIGAALADDDDDGIADRRLAELIGLLRAMQPSLRGFASTLERELALIQAHARVAGEPGLLPERLAFDVTEDAARARLAPLVLLPLLRWLAMMRPAGWNVVASRVDGRLLIEGRARDGGPAEPLAEVLPSPVVDTARQRLIAVHGPGASLRVDAAAAGFLLEVDTDHDPHPDR